MEKCRGGDRLIMPLEKETWGKYKIKIVIEVSEKRKLSHLKRKVFKDFPFFKGGKSVFNRQHFFPSRTPLGGGG